MTFDLSIFQQPKIDCHAHIFDPANFPFNDSVTYHPVGGEVGTADHLRHVMDSYGIRHVLLVQPNSGYGTDNSYMLHAIEQGGGRFKGMASVPYDASLRELTLLKEAGIVGVALNATFGDPGGHRGAGALLKKLAALDMFVNLQVQKDDILMFMPCLEEIPVRILIDHCGRPDISGGLNEPGFRALLKLAATGRAYVKISGYMKFSQQPFPFTDAHEHIKALVDTFTPQQCLWASDWPFLHSKSRQDYGPLIGMMERFVSDASDRRTVLWETPRRLFEFESEQ